MPDWVGLHDVNLERRVHVRASAITAFYSSSEVNTQVIVGPTYFTVRETEEEICRLLGIKTL